MGKGKGKGIGKCKPKEKEQIIRKIHKSEKKGKSKAK